MILDEGIEFLKFVIFYLESYDIIMIWVFVGNYFKIFKFFIDKQYLIYLIMFLKMGKGVGFFKLYLRKNVCF